MPRSSRSTTPDAETAPKGAAPFPTSTVGDSVAQDIETTRVCKTCGQEKPIEEFPKRERYRNGRLPHCHPCAKQRARERRAADPERWKEYRRRSWVGRPSMTPEQREKARAADRKLYRENRERLVAARGAWRRNNPGVGRAHRAVRQAIDTGRLVRPPTCQECGAACKPDAHHPDYDKPLDVMWLCQSCHRKEHTRNG